MSNEPSKNALYIAECILAADLNARGIASHIDAFAAREIERRREAEAEIGRLRGLLLEFAEGTHRASMIGAEAMDRADTPVDRQGGSPDA